MSGAGGGEGEGEARTPFQTDRELERRTSSLTLVIGKTRVEAYSLETLNDLPSSPLRRGTAHVAGEGTHKGHSPVAGGVRT